MSYASFIIEHNSINIFDECSNSDSIYPSITTSLELVTKKKWSKWRIGMAVVSVYYTDLSITGVTLVGGDN